MIKRIQTYFSEIDFRIQIIRKYNREKDLFLSSQFNVFDYMYADENRLSDIIADLLNPDGKHGQDKTFLNEFVKLLDRKDLIREESPKVKREEGTVLIHAQKRRMDILIEWPNDGIMIENKPWAIDQQKQISDYRDHLNVRFKKDYLIVYLSNNPSPKDHSISRTELNLLLSNKQFIQINFNRDLKTWVDNCKKECQSKK